jgi:hypothetical protein
MLDIADLIAERGGDAKKVKESQRKRYASEELVDEVIGLYEKARASTIILRLLFAVASGSSSLNSREPDCPPESDLCLCMLILPIRGQHDTKQHKSDRR